MIRGHLPADHPLDVVEIDHTPLNVYVIDDLSFLPLGRPWLTAIKDRYSKVILGCAPCKGGAFPVGESPTRRNCSSRK